MGAAYILHFKCKLMQAAAGHPILVAGPTIF